MLCVLYCTYVPRSLQLELSFNSCFALLFASAEKCELAKREKACMKRLSNTVGIYVIYGFQELKPQPFLNTTIRSGIMHYGTGLGLVIETLTGTQSTS